MVPSQTKLIADPVALAVAKAVEAALAKLTLDVLPTSPIVDAPMLTTLQASPIRAAGSRKRLLLECEALIRLTGAAQAGRLLKALAVAEQFDAPPEFRVAPQSARLEATVRLVLTTPSAVRAVMLPAAPVSDEALRRLLTVKFVLTTALPAVKAFAVMPVEQSRDLNTPVKQDMPVEQSMDLNTPVKAVMFEARTTVPAAIAGAVSPVRITRFVMVPSATAADQFPAVWIVVVHPYTSVACQE